MQLMRRQPGTAAQAPRDRAIAAASLHLELGLETARRTPRATRHISKAQYLNDDADLAWLASWK